MSKLSKILCLCFITLLLLSSICMATDIAPTSDDSLVENESVEHIHEDEEISTEISITNTDLYTADDDVVIEDVINGNAFVYGNNVTIKGQIYGDLFVAGNNVTIEESAFVANGIFVFGNSVVFNGSANDVYAFAQSFTMGENSYINRDLKLYSAQFNLNGFIQKDVYMAVGNITIPDNGQNFIYGDLHYTAQEEIAIPEGAVIGEVKFTQITTEQPTMSQMISTYIIRFLTTILYAIVVILLATYFAPKFIEKSNYTLMKRPFVSAGIGILAIVLIPVIAIILLMTGVLSYISMAVLAIYALVLSITLPIFSMAIAKSIEKKLKSPSKGKFILFSILAAIVLWLLQIIPYVGGYISLFIYVVGLGVALFAFFIRKDVNEVNSSK